MRQSPRSRTVITLAGALLALQWSLTAQTPVTAKTPAHLRRRGLLEVDPGHAAVRRRPVAGVCDQRAERGRRARRRNLRSGQEFKHARGTSPTFTPDGKFVVFTIAQPKAEEEREAAANPAAAPAAETPAPRRPADAADAAATRRATPRTGMGIMTAAPTAR